jgi:hypothetical protein
LSNRAYIGDNVGQRFTTKSFKVKKYIERSEGEWIIVPGMHEPIITQEVWDKAQEHLKSPKRGGRPRLADALSIFAGIIYCHDCGNRLVRKRTKNHYYYSCTGHDTKGYLGNDKPCSTHYIREDLLSDVVCGEINRQLDGFKVSTYTRDTNATRRLNHTLEKYGKRNEELKTIIRRLIEKNAKDIIDDNTFEDMMHEYQIERQAVENGINSTRAELASDPKLNAKASAEMLKRFKPMNVLSKDSLALIDRLVVYETDGRHQRKGRTQLVEIHYKHVGLIGDAVVVGERLEAQQ